MGIKEGRRGKRTGYEFLINSFAETFDVGGVDQEFTASP